MERAFIIAFCLILKSTLSLESPHIWFGSAPFCGNQTSKCAELGFQFVGEDPYGDGHTCWTGRKTLCMLNEPKNTDKTPSDDKIIKLVHYNVDENPKGPIYYEKISGLSMSPELQNLSSKSYDGSIERICRIPEAFEKHLSSVDYISLFGMHSEGCEGSANLVKLFDFYGWKYSSGYNGDKYFPNAGILTFSKHPMSVNSFEVFKSLTKNEPYPVKGYHIGCFKKNSEICVVTANLEESNCEICQRVKARQLLEIKKSLAKLNRNASVIFQANLGINLLDVKADKFEKYIESVGIEIDTEIISHSPTTNDLVRDDEEQWNEYTGYIRRFRKPKRSKSYAVELTADELFSYKAGRSLIESLMRWSEHGLTMNLAPNYPVITDIEL